jgi:phosphopantothenoylcysteine decarboxylase/phosphopantothenate--cysteine ligase
MSAPKILLGVSGGIAAYKAAELVRVLDKAGAEVQVILTGRAEAFVTPMTLATLSKRPVARTEFPNEAGPEIGHIDLAAWGDVLAIAPATANVLARLARGLGDDLLSTVALAFEGPLVLAPAMNPKMWDHAETRDNVSRLAAAGAAIVEPEEGVMACGDQGPGRLPPVETIAAEILAAAERSQALAGLRVVVSAGPTHEPIDPVRYVGNRSSGRMGYAVARAARARGAEVVLVSGPTSLTTPFGVRRVDVVTAEELREAVLQTAADADIVVMTAAIADHRPDAPAAEKLSRKGEPFSLQMVPNPDVLSELVSRRDGGALPADLTIVGFAAETGDAPAKGADKRKRKGCDLLFANDVSAPGAGFEGDTNVVTPVGPQGAEPTWPLLSKRQVADRLWERIARHRSAALRRGG